MFFSPQLLDSVLAHYPTWLRGAGVNADQAGAFIAGLSGAHVWRLTTAGGDICLRCWPRRHPSHERLAAIHGVLMHLKQHGFDLVPVPFATLAGETYVESHGQLWDVTPWMPGEANYPTQPNPVKLRNAFLALAELHQAAESFALPIDEVPPGQGPSPGIASRHQQLAELLGGKFAKIRGALPGNDDSPFATAARRIVESFPRAATWILERLARSSEILVALQPVVRDIHAEHVLFEGDNVSGIIDFGAVRIDTVATDVARLLGSMVGDNENDWQVGRAAYEEVRPLTDDERRLIKVFDQSTVLLAGTNWLEWIYIDGWGGSTNATEIIKRESRLNEIADRLAFLVQTNGL